MSISDRHSIVQSDCMFGCLLSSRGSEPLFVCGPSRCTRERRGGGEVSAQQTTICTLFAKVTRNRQIEVAKKAGEKNESKQDPRERTKTLQKTNAQLLYCKPLLETSERQTKRWSYINRTVPSKKNIRIDTYQRGGKKTKCRNVIKVNPTLPSFKTISSTKELLNEKRGGGNNTQKLCHP